MKQITIISGKGGTGKTSLTGSLAAKMPNAIFTDCDVDAADLYLLLEPDIHVRHPFPGGSTAVIDQEKCTSCDICRQLCRFDAIREKDGVYSVSDFNCEGCELCMHACPEKAIHMVQEDTSEWFESDTRFGPMIHARLGIGEDLSGKLVAQLRERAREVAKEKNADYILTDGPPGVGCPVIASITGADLAIAITEPTMSGLGDLKRVHQLSGHFKIPLKVIINKSDINEEMAQQIANYCRENEIEMIAQIPYDKVFLDAMIHRQTLPEYSPENRLTEIIEQVAEQIK
jgi:MinD superfamily P-loop ATPase